MASLIRNPGPRRAQRRLSELKFRIGNTTACLTATNRKNLSSGRKPLTLTRTAARARCARASATAARSKSPSRCARSARSTGRRRRAAHLPRRVLACRRRCARNAQRPADRSACRAKRRSPRRAPISDEETRRREEAVADRWLSAKRANSACGPKKISAARLKTRSAARPPKTPPSKRKPKHVAAPNRKKQNAPPPRRAPDQRAAAARAARSAATRAGRRAERTGRAHQVGAQAAAGRAGEAGQEGRAQAPRRQADARHGRARSRRRRRPRAFARGLSPCAAERKRTPRQDAGRAASAIRSSAKSSFRNPSRFRNCRTAWPSGWPTSSSS